MTNPRGNAGVKLELIDKFHPMLSFEWLSSWWHHFGNSNRLHLVCVAENERLLGAVPCYIHGTRTGKQLRFLGSDSVCSDYLTAIVDAARSASIYEAISSYFRQAAERELRDLDALHFEGMDYSDPCASC